MIASQASLLSILSRTGRLKLERVTTLLTSSSITFEVNKLNWAADGPFKGKKVKFPHRGLSLRPTTNVGPVETGEHRERPRDGVKSILCT
jgi:hypothetical protein